MKTFDIGLGGYSILQSPNMTHTQMMGYIIKTPNGNLIVIDGGNPGDAGYLREQIMESGGHVDLWLITHCHDDHFCALMKILEAPDGITIDRICYNFPPRDWLEAVEPSDWNRAFFEVIDANTDLFQVLYEKDTLNIDGLQIEVLNDPMDFQQFTDPSANLLEKIAEFFGVSVDYLVTGKEYTPAPSQTVNQGIFGDRNHNNTVTINGNVPLEVSEIEGELLKVCASLDIRRKNALLTYAYKLENEMSEG